MNNYIEKGEVLELTAPVGGVVKNTPYKIGDLIVIATVSADAGAKFSAFVGPGVVEVAKVSAQAWTENVKVYWDNTAGNFTTTSSGNTLAGTAAKAAANPSATGWVRLDGVAR